MNGNGRYLARAVREALSVEDWSESIRRVKEAVGRALERWDRGVRVRNTGYFNHSFVPDFTLEWGSESRKRDVFLRLDASFSFLSDDIRYLGPGKPILIGLTEATQEPEVSPLSRQASTSDVLIAYTEAVEEFGEPPRAAQFGTVIPSAVLRGGKGVVDDETAEKLVSTGVHFFGGARTHQPQTVSQSAAFLTNYLTQSETSSVVNFGRIVWEATGGAPFDFPLESTLQGLDDDAIRFLLEEGPTEDLSYWRAIGSSITLERLISLDVLRPSNLRNLLAANLDRLTARILKVIPSDATLEATPYWTLGKGRLELRGEDFRAMWAAKREELPVEEVEASVQGRQEGISMATLRERTQGETVKVVTVETTDQKTVTVESPTAIDLESDDTLGSLAQARVDSVALLLSGRYLECRFDDLTAAGHTTAQFELLEFLEVALPVLWQLTESDRHEIEDLLNSFGSARASEALFDLRTLGGSRADLENRDPET